MRVILKRSILLRGFKTLHEGTFCLLWKGSARGYWVGMDFWSEAYT